MLEVKNVSAGYHRDLNILRDLSITAASGKITAILGANGVGKSTALKAIYGFLRPTSGDIMLGGKSIVDLPVHQKISHGLAYIPQQHGIFPNMLVEENIHIGAWTYRREKKRIADKLEEAYARYPVLREKRRQAVGELSGGQQRMVEISRALMSNPKVMLVDEPTAGLSKMLSEEVYQMLTDLRDNDNLTILLVDQEIRQALSICDYVYVLELGKNKSDGPVSEYDDLERAFWVE